MDETLQMLILGAIQGIAEWLPVSSEGLLTLVQLHVFGKSFEASLGTALWLHLGTALAALVYFRSDVLHLVCQLPSWTTRRSQLTDDDRRLMDFLAIATAATGALGLPLMAVSFQADLVMRAATALIGGLLILTGILQRVARSFGTRVSGDAGAGDAVLTGLMQGLAVLPGVSRSGFTVAALLFRRFEETEALRLSFLVSIPAILGAQVLVELGGVVELDLAAAATGTGAAALVGWATIAGLIRVARTLPFWAIAIGLGTLTLIAALAVPQ